MIAVRNGAPILINNIPTVKAGAALKRGDGSFNGQRAVVATIQKQPNANTLEVTSQIESTLANLKNTLPPDVAIDTKAFQQADFIKRSIGNVQASLVEGGVMVAVVLFLFLWNFRTTFISLSAIPLSLLSAILVMSYFGLTLNTMTLGGLAIARLNGRRRKPSPRVSPTSFADRVSAIPPTLSDEADSSAGRSSETASPANRTRSPLPSKTGSANIITEP